MTIPNHLGAILERIRANTFTAADLELLEQALSYTAQTSVSQSGKYNLNLDEGSINVGDRYYGYSSNDIRSVIQEILRAQTRQNTEGYRQSEEDQDNEQLEIPAINPNFVRLVNSRLSAIEELKNAGQLPDSQQTEFRNLKNKVRCLTDIDQELEEIASSVTRMLAEAVKLLTNQLQDLSSSQHESLLEARSQVCIEQQIELLNQFHMDLEQGKIVAHWLNRQRAPLVEELINCALAAYPEIRDTASPKTLKAFRLSIEQWLERLIQCLIWGRTDSLINPVTYIVLDDAVYTTAFNHLKTQLPAHLPSESIGHLREYIDFLIENLPNYRHRSIG